MNVSVNRLIHQRATSSGFTLIELMVTIAVLAIIMSIAAPNISNQLANQRVKSTTAILANALKEAKVESVIRRQEIKVSHKNNGTSAGTIEIKDDNSNTVAAYQYDARTTIKPDGTNIEFKPSKTADEMVFTICDSNTAASPQQITVSAVATIISRIGGTCP